ncbi:hypothetical protein FA10DRAFT_262916 [Acaromyces ingoldii]|uniref:Uncharacterized protein n=1 Tax=Acaromyces ingoldii TaxID=215250 RepID=A0A316YD63_9BASI|nr:hypothetical protein FA10DRAFT_262916 [Acaromyces ingoldii]PWN87169.1 hypothetical protein FA10DRAFT_262916 [Acaromyces ingoldii]
MKDIFRKLAPTVCLFTILVLLSDSINGRMAVKRSQKVLQMHEALSPENTDPVDVSITYKVMVNNVEEGRCTDVSSQTHDNQVVHGRKQRAVTNTEVHLEFHVYLCDRVEPSKLKRGRQCVFDCSMEKAATTSEKAVEVIKKLCETGHKGIWKPTAV